jgi:hypothetical protein
MAQIISALVVIVTVLAPAGTTVRQAEPPPEPTAILD